MPDCKEEQRRIVRIALDAATGGGSPDPVASDTVYVRLQSAMPFCLPSGLMLRHIGKYRNTGKMRVARLVSFRSGAIAEIGGMPARHSRSSVYAFCGILDIQAVPR